MAADALSQLEELYKAGFIPEEEYTKRKSALPDPEKDHAERIFQYFDTDKDNAISAKEFQNLVYELGEIMTTEQVKEIVSLLDTDKNGTIEFNEFYNWWVSPDHKMESISDERLKILKAKLTSKSYMRIVKGAANKLRVSQTGSRLKEKAKTKCIITDTDDNLVASIDVEFGELSNVEAGINLTHRRDPAAASAFRNILGKDESSAITSLSFACKPDANLTHLNSASKYLTNIMKEMFENNEIPTEEFKWHVSHEEKGTVLRASAVFPVEFSMMGAGLLKSVGIHDLGLNLDFGGGASRLKFRASVSRGSIALVEELVSDHNLKSFATYFLNNFCGADIKFKFVSLEEAANHLVVSPLLNIKDEFVLSLLKTGQKLTSSQHTGVHHQLLDQILPYFANENELEFFQASWFATKCAKDNLKELSKLTVVVGDEIFEAEFNVPQLLELLPSQEKADVFGLLDKSLIPRKYVITNGEAATLPQRKQWVGHEEHELELRPKFLDWVDDYWCDFCEKDDHCNSFGSGWCYTCPECMVVIHPEHLK